jgi:hypothetical protein
MNHRLLANRGQFRGVRQLQRDNHGRLILFFQSLEQRQLLASDISLTDFAANGRDLLVSYDIAVETAPAFNLSIYRSSDGVTLDALVASRAVTLVCELDPGAHTI